MEPSGKERRGLGQPGCEEAAAQGASGTGGSGAGSGGAAARRANRRGHQPGVSALEFDIHLSRVYPPPFFLQQFLKSTFFPVLIYFLLPTPRLNRADCLGRLLLYFPKSLRILETSREKKEVARAPERSRGRERETGSESARGRASNDRDRGKVSDLLLGVTARARREPSPSGSRIGPAALTDRQTDTAPRPSSHLLPGRRPRVDAAASRGQEPEPAPGGGVEGVGARGVAVKLFVQLLGCSRSGGAVVRAGAAEPSGTGRSASSGREEPQSEEGEEEEEKEEERGPRWRLGARKPGSWTGEAAVCADSAPAARAPQALARASARGGRGDRLGAEESGPPRSPSRRGSASRAGSGRASETMNFLLSWVHWSLALLLYLHHAKWSQAAPMAEGEHKPHEVVKFMDVYQRSYCRPIETLVDIFQEYPDEIEYIFKPSCVPLMRCGGCCNDEGLECVPTEEFNITMQIMRIKPHQGQHIGEMSFLQHSKCECRPKKDRARQEKKSIRGKGKGQKRKRKKARYKPWSVPCGPCSERRKHLFVQDPQTCKCSCKNTDSRCKARQLELNERTCRCDKPRR
ncbi:vascular endothelial growth factor A, long form [Halichoerus grypus]|uniref:vascular endothelial growth factor A n=1 Tax=Halichoerus grypus TaxID=9711 RepID=UPI001658DC02|nr:vascular endothelial growth factor A [Halichoerus grypus]